jgi:hypothetical protein
MKNFAIELEFFIKRGSEYRPAFEFTQNLDGNPVVGEIKTGIFSNPVDLIFDLQKRFYVESKAVEAKGATIELVSEISLSKEIRRELRANKGFIERKNLEILQEKSIYQDGELSRELELGQFIASLQINFSNNQEILHRYVDKDNKDRSFQRNVSNIYDYYSDLRALDKEFEEEIVRSNRIPGVYAIKEGSLGNRIEYRSLPNTICFERLLNALEKLK